MSIRQIARLAGLSKSAVSLALRNSPKIPEVTKARVRKFARQVGYRPNAKMHELMSQLRASEHPRIEACLGVISLYRQTRPWENSTHLGRIYEGMLARAAALGYRLEALGVQTPGMTIRRARAIFDMRAIEGLLSFGGPDFDAELPAEFNHYAIVTVGLSIKSQLHRVITDSYDDIWSTLNRVHELGYRRPGLVIGKYEEVRNGYAHVSAYFGWSEHMFGSPLAIPVLRQERVEEAALQAWLRLHRPDVVVVVHHYDVLAEFGGALRKLGIRVPEDLGVAALSQVLDGTGFSGMQENQPIMGAWAVELLVARIMNRDLGFPVHPRIEMVKSLWTDGRSLRKQG